MEQMFYDVRMAMRFSKWLEYRPTECRMCGAELPIKKTGRPRFTCSDKCRQRMRRLDWETWQQPRMERRKLRRAEREVKRIEKALGGEGALDAPTPGYEWLTLRKRVLIRVERGEELPFCRVCGRPYIIDGRRRRTCSDPCTDILRERERAVQEAVSKFAGRYDPRVDVRLRLGLPIKVCKQCGRPFPDYTPRQVYCSDRCRKNAWYARHPRRHCVACGKAFRRCSGRARNDARNGIDIITSRTALDASGGSSRETNFCRTPIRGCRSTGGRVDGTGCRWCSARRCAGMRWGGRRATRFVRGAGRCSGRRRRTFNGGRGTAQRTAGGGLRLGPSGGGCMRSGSLGNAGGADRTCQRAKSGTGDIDPTVRMNARGLPRMPAGERSGDSAPS